MVGGLDPVSALHVKAMELCELYSASLGQLMVQAPPLPVGGAQSAARGCCRKEAEDLASSIVAMHREIDRLIDDVEAAEASEEEQLREIEALHAENAMVTEQLRERVHRAERVRRSVRRDLDRLLTALDSDHSIAVGQ